MSEFENIKNHPMFKNYMDLLPEKDRKICEEDLAYLVKNFEEQILIPLKKYLFENDK